MPLHISKRMRLAGIATAIASIIGVAVLNSANYSSRAVDAVMDAGLSRTTGNERITDLMTSVVEPGAEVTTGVSLPPGARVSSVMPANAFTVVSQTHTDHPADTDAGVGWTWYEIRARNDGIAPLRFVAFIAYDVTPTDGGI
jgi:hypothetical protein